MGTKRYRIRCTLCSNCVFSVIALVLMAMAPTNIGANGYGTDTIQEIKNDGNCDGPDIGTNGDFPMARKPTYEELENRNQELEQAESEWKQAEKALRESEARFKRASDNSPAVLYQFMMAPGGEVSFPYVSDVIVATMGVTPEEVMEDPSKLLGMVHPDDQKMFQEGINRAAESLESFPLTFRCMKDGEVIWIEARGMPTPLADGGILWDGFLLDITERKQAEEALENGHRELEQKVEERTAELRKTTEQLKALMNATTDTVLLIDLKGNAVAATSVTARRFGISLDQLLGTCTYDLMSPSLAKSRKAKADRVIKTGKPHRFEDERKGIIFDSTIYPVFDEQGTVAQLAIYGKDITKQVKTYRELEEKEKDLAEKTSLLQDANIALKIMLQKSSENRKDVEEEILTVLKKRIVPYISKLKQCDLDKNMRDYVHMLESNLKDIVSPFSREWSFEYINLTPKEIEIANLIRENRTTKQISERLKVSPGTINYHRNNIRNKFEIKNKKRTLKSYLNSIR